MNDDSYKNWELIQRATTAGWVDPGHTESLTETARRAAEYLEQRPAPTVGESR